jgi:hypothetical protein
MSVLSDPAGPAVAVPGYGPVALRSAYKLTKAAASKNSRTVAIVGAFSDPNAATDLAAYRSHFKLPACTKANGCLRIVNEHGGTGGLPNGEPSWATLQTTGLDVISALCPYCKLLVVDASSNSLTDLGIAEETAASLGAKFVFNGWSSIEFTGEDAFAHYFNHPGAAIVFASGDQGYGPRFPVDLPYVTAVGGTSLTRSSFNSRGWAETAWTQTASGCATLGIKPSWQRADARTPAGCLNRTENDVAADADPATGAAIFDTYATGKTWAKAGGTALAAAIVTATYALAGTPLPRTYPASYPYQHASHLFDVKFGSNGGSCELNRTYLCTADQGYDGPTGLGTPNGTAAFTDAGSQPVTLMDPGTRDLEAGHNVAISITGFDARAGAAPLAYSATGLPAGLSIAPVPQTTNAKITGTLPTTVTSYAVTVTAKDNTTGQVGTTHFSIVAAASLTPTAPITTAITTNPNAGIGPATGNCLDSGAGSAGTVVTIQTCTGVAAQVWTYLPEGAPGAPAEVTINGLCMANVSGSIQLAACTKANAMQSWQVLFGGVLKNTGSGTCLATTSNGNPLTMQACNTAVGDEQWHMTAASIQSGVTGMCVAEDDDGFHSSSYMIEPCHGGFFQGFSFNNDGSVSSSLGRCMIGSGVRRDGGGVSTGFCDAGAAQDWLVGPGGELINSGSGLCLDDPGATQVAGTQLDLQDCDGRLGEVWAIA